MAYDDRTIQLVKPIKIVEESENYFRVTVRRGLVISPANLDLLHLSILSGDLVSIPIQETHTKLIPKFSSVAKEVKE